jgi:hypothetical protein
MGSRQLRTLGTAAGAILVVWLLAWGGYAIARSTKMTGEKIKEYLHSVDFAKLSPSQRDQALKDLAAKLNSLTPEERRQAHWRDEWKSWFELMTESEKEMFIEATLPTDVKQMIDSFEKMPPDKRKKTIDTAMKNLREARDSGPPGPGGTNSAQLDPALAQKAQTLGLKTFYNESSPETKAELAPLLEEIQHQMESGRAFRQNQN